MSEVQEQASEHDFVEYELEFKDGVIVGCNYFGEGGQVEPLDGLKVYVPTGQPVDHRSFRWIEHVERRLKIALSRLS